MSGAGEAAEAAPRHSRPRRLFDVAAFVAVWIAIGEATGAGVNAYLLIGIPLTLAFQLGLRRRRIPELWVRRAPPIERRRLFAGLAIAFAVYPVYALVVTLADPPAGEAGLLVYLAAAAIGAGAAAYAFSRFDRTRWRWLGFTLATAGVIGALPVIVGIDIETINLAVIDRPRSELGLGMLALLLYAPAMYVIEEVSFRAALGSHACLPQEEHVVPTAIYLAFLWGVWQAPIVGWDQLPLLIAYHSLIGTFLSIGWHNSGNLAVSATAHAAYSSVRAALL